MYVGPRNECMHEITDASMNVKVPPNLRVCPPGKKVVHALFSRKPPTKYIFIER